MLASDIAGEWLHGNHGNMKLTQPRIENMGHG
jgi:hypothetical protein